MNYHESYFKRQLEAIWGDLNVVQFCSYLIGLLGSYLIMHSGMLGDTLHFDLNCPLIELLLDALFRVGSGCEIPDSFNLF